MFSTVIVKVSSVLGIPHTEQAHGFINVANPIEDPLFATFSRARTAPVLP